MFGLCRSLLVHPSIINHVLVFYGYGILWLWYGIMLQNSMDHAMPCAVWYYVLWTIPTLMGSSANFDSTDSETALLLLFVCFPPLESWDVLILRNAKCVFLFQYFFFFYSATSPAISLFVFPLFLTVCLLQKGGWSSQWRVGWNTKQCTHTLSQSMFISITMFIMSII